MQVHSLPTLSSWSPQIRWLQNLGPVRYGAVRVVRELIQSAHTLLFDGCSGRTAISPKFFSNLRICTFLYILLLPLLVCASGDPAIFLPWCGCFRRIIPTYIGNEDQISSVPLQNGACKLCTGRARRLQQLSWFSRTSGIAFRSVSRKSRHEAAPSYRSISNTPTT